MIKLFGLYFRIHREVTINVAPVEAPSSTRMIFFPLSCSPSTWSTNNTLSLLLISSNLLCFSIFKYSSVIFKVFMRISFRYKVESFIIPPIDNSLL